MAKNLLNKYVWLVETIYKAKKISYEEINRRWLDNDMSEGKPLSLRTFHKWRIAIEEMFGLIIENEQGGQYRYYIKNADDLKSGSMRSWLFNTLTVSNLMMESVSIKDKILFEEIPDGEQYLPVIIEALKKNTVLEMTYQSFWRDETNTFEVEPYCLKAFKQRWYLVARSPYYDKIMIYALDRVHQLEPTGNVFKYPDDFVAEEYFEDCFGIIADQNYDVETVKFKVSAGQANYLRSLTLHQTQGRLSGQMNTASSLSNFVLPSISGRRFYHRAAILRCWSLNGSVMRWLRFQSICGTNTRMTNERFCSNRL